MERFAREAWLRGDTQSAEQACAYGVFALGLSARDSVPVPASGADGPSSPLSVLGVTSAAVTACLRIAETEPERLRFALDDASAKVAQFAGQSMPPMVHVGGRWRVFVGDRDAVPRTVAAAVTYLTGSGVSAP